MSDDPILDANGTYGEIDEFAELTDAGIGGVDGESFGQDLLGDTIPQLQSDDSAAVDDAYLYDQPLPTDDSNNEVVKQEINSDVKSEEIKPSTEALSATTEPTSFPAAATIAVPAEPLIDEKLEIDDLMAGKLIGHGGDVIRRLQVESGCRMQITPRMSGRSQSSARLSDRLNLFYALIHCDATYSLPHCIWRFSLLQLGSLALLFSGPSPLVFHGLDWTHPFAV